MKTVTMPSWPTALGGMLFAGYAATQAQKVGIDNPTSLLASALKNLNSENGPSSSGRSSSGSEVSRTVGDGILRGRAASGPGLAHGPTTSYLGVCAQLQLSVLQGEVDRLHKLLSDVVRGQKNNGYTVIHTGEKSVLRGRWEGRLTMLLPDTYYRRFITSSHTTLALPRRQALAQS